MYIREKKSAKDIAAALKVKQRKIEAWIENYKKAIAQKV